LSKKVKQNLKSIEKENEKNVSEKPAKQKGN